MKLRYISSSPFVRKVLAVAIETGLEDRIEKVLTQPLDPATDLGIVNPLGKVPALETEGGEVLYDSRVICEYLDSLHDGIRLFPASGGARWTALRHQALADGILDAAVTRRYEEAYRPSEFCWKDWVERQNNKISLALDAFDEEADGFGNTVTIGHITLGCALGYLDFRYHADGWLASRPALADWWYRFSTRPSMAKTEPADSPAK
ncbi:MAG: glutathione S-transferase N-terminal domain-containing protein [Rhodospirillales bacterium]|nr:glutathione S-transferase N-terminal domain-containing protein [Rhodospirillales bacterium]MCW8861182.1 glutathione S-transferase N-terminal domain-containing protein [Rhodospirillales bacterium]MCW8951910.1 glutathione S-transferase N-terminal domain-containing protein [Rhodospirillales bacterium]MCW8971058.1 glutathione S-transferase N-terminal domain-containing protein [Rhodospirillales bacterium]MCW9002653.1 glutathione S-transferase N-terminal domain-containing protein [Rhodospirillales